MSLFPFENPIDLLPQDGSARYFGKIFDTEIADQLFEQLLSEISWQHDRAIIYGKEYVTRRMVAWYGLKPFAYTYSNTTKIALPFTQLLQELAEINERYTGEKYNSCLLNLYHDGDEGMAWHSDAERDLRKHGSIASLSFGAERKFSFKHKVTGEVKSIVLEHGSLLEMSGQTQDFWLHRLPPSKRIKNPRINLTFRQIVG